MHSNPAASNTGRFQYTGQLWLNDAGVYHYKNRAYHPGLMRFLQADPIGVNGGINLYAYVGGDPVNFTDPMGLRRCITQYHYRVGDPVYDDDGEFIGWEAILIGQTEYCFARGVEFVRTEMAEGEGGGGTGSPNNQRKNRCNEGGLPSVTGSAALGAIFKPQQV